MTLSPYANAATAEAYNNIAVPHQFAAPAQDLVTLLQLSIGGRILDVGSGTGITAAYACASVGQAGTVVALDPSAAMLRCISDQSIRRVVGAMPGLPFRNNQFDAVLGSFVLTHVSDYAAALTDMCRLLYPGGRLGTTTWAAGQHEAGQAWKDVAAGFISRDELQQAFQQVIPWEAWFANEQHVRAALQNAGLQQVNVLRRTYQVSIGIHEFVMLREASVEGTLLRCWLTTQQWDAFRQRIHDVLRERCTDPLEYTRDVYFGLGVKPDGPR